MRSKKLLIGSAVLLILAMLVGGCAEPQDNTAGNGEKQQVIQTYGEAELTAGPDLAKLSVEVETQSRSADEAVEENARLANEVREALLEYGLTEEDIKTGSYRLRSHRERPEERPVPDRPEPDTPEEPEAIIYYRANNEIMISTSQIEEVGEIIDLAVEAGANQVNYINFELEDPQDLKMQALKGATEQALKKAEAIAESAGETIIGLHSIQEERTEYTPFRQVPEVAEEVADQAAPTPIEPEEVQIRATVIAEYSF